MRRVFSGVLAVLLAFTGPRAVRAESLEVTEKVRIFDAVSGKVDDVERVVRSDAEWKALLTPERFSVLRQKATEKPERGKCFLPERRDGVYKCAGCGTDLFLAGSRYESGSGWPSFWEPVSDLNVREATDNSGGAPRTEIVCGRCGGHLGHVFPDGPPPTGRRYCVNSAALIFMAADEQRQELKKAAFAAGCFWGVQDRFKDVKGVEKATAGYAGGETPDPEYEQVLTGKTGHAETVELLYDPDEVSYGELLEVFWNIHDPTTVDRQGPDRGSQYRSVIFYHSGEQKREALESKERLERSGRFKGPIVTEIVPAGEFYPAEEYHQCYLDKKEKAGRK